MQATLFETFFEDSDYEYKNINEMNLIQLVIYKKQMLSLNDNTCITDLQNNQFDKFVKSVWLEYPATLMNSSEIEAKKDDKIRKLEFKRFKLECIKINKLKFENAADMLQKIETLETELKIISKAKYDAEHKIYMNEKVICECGMESIRHHKSRHKKSKVHLVYEAKLIELEEAKKLKIQKIEQQKQVAAKKNNGYDLDENGKIVWPLNENRERFYLTDANGKNIYPKCKEGQSIWMKDINGFTIKPEQEKCRLF